MMLLLVQRRGSAGTTLPARRRPSAARQLDDVTKRFDRCNFSDHPLEKN